MFEGQPGEATRVHHSSQWRGCRMAVCGWRGKAAIFSRHDWRLAELASLPRRHACGYSDGQNVKYELQTDEIEPARLAEAAKELASIPVDVIAARFCPDARGLRRVQR